VTIATAGVAMNEERLRAYIKCSQLFYYGGVEKPSPQTRMAQYAVEYYLTARLRDSKRERAYLLSKAVLQATKTCELETKLLHGQAQQLINQTALWLDEFLNLFSDSMYYPITGPLPWRIKINRTAIDLKISGILRTAKNQTLHVLSFTPYTTRHSQVNDPVVHLKLNALKDFVKKNPNRPQAMLHMLWSRANGHVGFDHITTKSINPEYLKLIGQKIQEAERGSHFPVLPCRFACPFKTKCFPGENK
tara:strand:+ start:70 stop:813 length:744 start_codon:yes stop_codon:yes gene_type:complete